ncbi:fatty acid desaturase [Sphingomonas qomolangmaensis]|uniref:Fatty acid desaturase n=1 Tax=Sphingomonas qomolangmaensis TaxID=2918765 RepID=A0ABY5LBT6_9SPHN|nr:fatty acid desaturase [Sphingomonas qomolangmaensis]UUL83872.1 fatty acid desaturase [Sphingomonas qomolangmaensis]
MTAVAHSTETPARYRWAAPRQALIGTSLAIAICTAWLAIHFVSMFVLEIDLVTLPLVAVLMALQCWLSVGMFIVAHDAMHGSLAPGRTKLNARIGAGLLLLYAGFGWTKMREAHFEHHRHAGSERDPDFDAANPRNFVRWYTTFLKRYFGWQSGLYVMTVVNVYWLVFGVPLANIILLYGLPAILSSLQLFYFGTYRPHRHDDEGFTDRHNARSEGFGTLASLASCFHFGYHHEHHVNPGVPWWGLPACRRATLRSGSTQ